MAKRGGDLAEVLRFAAAEINAALQNGATWSATSRALEDDGEQVAWPDVLASAPTDLAADFLAAAVRCTVRAWLYAGGDTRVLDFETGPEAAAVPLTIRADKPGGFNPHGAIRLEMECWIKADTYGGQWLLLTALSCAEHAYARAVERFGPGKVNGLHDLKNQRRRRQVLDAWDLAGGNVQAAAELSGVSLAAAYRIINRRNDPA